MLAVAVGVREAARQMELPEATVQAWSARYGWFESQVVALPPTMKGATVATKAPDALENVLRERHKKTRLGLSKYVRDAAHVAAKSKGDLNLAPAVKAVADIMGKVWPQEAATTNIQVNTLSAKLEL